jgi:hypothetical protein
VNETKKIVGVVALVAVMGVAIYAAKGRQPGFERDPAGALISGGNPQQNRVMEDIVDLVVGSETKGYAGIKSKADVQPVLDQVKRIVGQNSQYPMVKVAGGIVKLIELHEGILWRLRHVVEGSDWIHASVLFRLRSTYYNNYLWGPHLTAIMDYIAEPTSTAGREPWEKASEAQNWLLGNVVTELESQVTELDKIMKDAKPKDVEFDFLRRILVGSAPERGLTLIDKEDNRIFIKPYLYTLKFLMERAMMGLIYVSAINLDDLPQVSTTIMARTEINFARGKVRDIKSYLRSRNDDDRPPKGITPKLVFDALASYPRFLTWRMDIPAAAGSPQGREKTKELLEWAYRLGRSSAENQLRGYVCGIKYHLHRSPNLSDAECMTKPSAPREFIPRGERFVYNPNLMVDDLEKKFNAFSQRVAVYSSPANDYATVTSDVTGQTLRLNVRKFFDVALPPRAFIPTGFNNPGAASDTDVTSRFGREYKWNYLHGLPNQYSKWVAAPNGTGRHTAVDYTLNGVFQQGSSFDGFLRNMTTLLYTDSVAPFAAFIRFPSTVRMFIGVSDLVDAN